MGNGFQCCTSLKWLYDEDETQGKECAPFSEWPDVDSVTCGPDSPVILGSCIALVNGPHGGDWGGSCDQYCNQFGHICAGAWEEMNENCVIKKEYQCHEPILDTSDMLCKCIYPPPPPKCEKA